MSQLQAEYVKRGFWTNHEVGPILGKTITTDVRTGNLIVALLAVLTTFGLGHLWNIVMFAYHQMRTHDHDSDGHFHQQQALLRTLPPPNAVATTWIKLWWTWRGRADRAFARTWAFAIASIVFTAATVAVGVFVSYVISNSSIEVLVDSSLCGPLNLYDDSIPTDTIAFEDYFATLTSLSRSYSQDCYQSISILPARCSAFVRPSVPFSTNGEACPFSKLCANISQPGVVMDSGLLDVNDAFGLNFEPEDAVRIRRKNTCAFLEIEGHYTMENQTYPNSQFRWKELLNLYYGQVKARSYNYTFQIDMLNSVVNRDYSTLQLVNAVSSATQQVELLPDMRTKDADLTIAVLLKNAVAYEHPVDDPFFAAHKEWVPEQPSGPNYTLYRSDFPVAVFACKQQYQFCAKASGATESCTELQGLAANSLASDYPGASALQLALIQTLHETILMTPFIMAVSGGVRAGDILHHKGLLMDLPDDQWLRELMAWEAHIWAALQIGVSDYATGYAARVATTTGFTRRNLTDGERRLCGSQRMRMPGGFVNINVFALAFVIALTCAFTILDIILLRILIFTRRFRAAFAPRIERWIQDGVFHQQRRGYEAQELAAWTRTDKEIPVTVKKVKLPQLQAQLNYAMSNVANTPASAQSTGVAAGNSTAGSGTVPGPNTSNITSATPGGQTASTQAPNTGTTHGSPLPPTTSPATTSPVAAPPTTPILPPNSQPTSQSPAQPVTQAQSPPNNAPNAAQPLAQSSAQTATTLPTAAPAASSSSRAQNTSMP